ncbi:MAG TPA: hypothetical protein VM715_04625 [Candidatus Acidoferrum sp.]|nr:hypothetical protein [Candidatus Acidoferrum sp.]
MPDTELWDALHDTDTVEPEPSPKAMTEPVGIEVERLFRDFDVIEVSTTGPEPFVLAARQPASAVSRNDAPMGEQGTVAPFGLPGWGGQQRLEYLPELMGQSGIRMVDRMKRSDGRVSSALRVSKVPVMSGRWYMQPYDNTPMERNKADFIWWNLCEGMVTSYPQFLWECMLMLDYGHMAFEKVFDVCMDARFRGKIMWKHLAPRHPRDIIDWNVDKTGTLQAIRIPGSDGPFTDLSIDKALIFTYGREAGDYRGMSVLRAAYKHWFYKDQMYKIDAIQKERHGIGIPLILLPAGFTADDKLTAEELGRNLRTNEQAHVVLPPNWDLTFIKIEGQPVKPMESIQHHDQLIYASVLAEFLLGVGGPEAKEMFEKSTRYIADIVADVINRYAIPQLVDYNWSSGGYPVLKVRRIGETVDWRILSFALRNLVGADILRPDDSLEEWVRDEMDLPYYDPDTVRASSEQPVYDDQGNIIDPKSGAIIQFGPEVQFEHQQEMFNQQAELASRQQGSANDPRKQSGQSSGRPRQGAPPSGRQQKNSGRDGSGTSGGGGR